MPTLHVYHSNAELPEHFGWQYQSFIRIKWWDGFVHDPHEPLAPEFWHPQYVVLAEDKALISAAKILRKTVAFEGETYITYGLGSVMTYPAFRGKGFGSQVVGRATEFIRQADDADIAILWTRVELQQFYGQHSWENLPNLTTLAGDPSNPEVFTSYNMMLFLSDRSKRNRPQFENGRLYFGEFTW